MPYHEDYRYFAIESAWNNLYSAMESDGFSNYDLWMEYLDNQKIYWDFAADEEGDEVAQKFIKKLIAHKAVNIVKQKNWYLV
jgi:hypothetical protein